MGAVVETRTVLALVVDGLPVQQGSMTPFPVVRRVAGGKYVPVVNRKTGFPLVDVKASNEKALKAWRKQVSAEARDAWAGREWIEDTPVFVSVEFRFPRRAGDLSSNGMPKSSAPYFKRTAPDVDKLQRAAFDALTDAEVWRDDALVVDVHARKIYAGNPGMTVWVSIPDNSKEATS